MRTFVALAALIILTACTTPQERCISDARSEQYAIASQIRTIEGNIARGYAIHYQTVTYTYLGVCDDGAGGTYPCEKTDTRTEETPVAIDVANEQAKLPGLRQRLEAARIRADAAVIQCRATYPE